MQVATRQSQSPIGLEVEPIARRHPMKRVAGWLVGLVALGAIGVGVLAGDGGTRPVPPKPHTVDTATSTNGSVVPVPVRAPDAVDGVSSADG